MKPYPPLDVDTLTFTLYETMIPIISLSPWILWGDRNSLPLRAEDLCVSGWHNVYSYRSAKRMKTWPGCKHFASRESRLSYRVVDAKLVSSSFSRPSIAIPRFSLLLASRGVTWKHFSNVEFAPTDTLCNEGDKRRNNTVSFSLLCWIINIHRYRRYKDTGVCKALFRIGSLVQFEGISACSGSFI